MSRKPRLFALLAVAMLLASTSAVYGRLWTDRSGRTIEADFVRIDGENVIVSRQGKEISIPLQRLSDADQTFAKSATPSTSGGSSGGADPFESGGKSGGGYSSGSEDDKESDKPGKYPLRSWRDRTTGVQVRARFISVLGQEVVLERNNGVRLNVPFHTLVENDQEYVEKELKKAGTAHLTPSRAPPQNSQGGGQSLPGSSPPGGYGGTGNGDVAPPKAGGFGSGSPPGGYSSPPGGSPPGYSTPPGGFGPPGSPGGPPPGGYGGPGSYAPAPGSSGTSPNAPSFEAPPGGYSSPPSGAPPGGYSSPPSGAPPGGFGSPGDTSMPPSFSTPPNGSAGYGGPPPGGYAPPGGYSSPPANETGPLGTPYGLPIGSRFEQTYQCSKCKKDMPHGFSVKAGDKCPYCGTYFMYKEDAFGRKEYAPGRIPTGYFVLGGGGFAAIAVIIGIVIRVIVSAVRD